MSPTPDEDLLKEAQQYFDANKRELDDVCLILVPEEFKDKFERLMLNFAKAPQNNQAILALYYRGDKTDPNTIYCLEFVGTPRQQPAVTELLTKKICLDSFSVSQQETDFTVHARRESVNFDELVAQLLELCLHQGRPLRHYNCTFYVPLDLFLEKELANSQSKLSSSPSESTLIEQHQIDTQQSVFKEQLDEPVGQEKQAYLYFLPHIRDFIFDTKHAATTSQKPTTQPIKHWRLRDLSEWKLFLGEKKECSLIVADVTDVSLYGYFNDLYVLAISVRPHLPGGSLHRDDATWWYDLVSSSDDTFRQQIQPSQLINWLRFTNQARIIYPSFHEQVKEGKITTLTLQTSTEEPISFKKEDTLSPILTHCLKKFFPDLPDLNERLKFLADDRMFVSVAYGLSGQAPHSQYGREELQRLLSLAVYVDDKNNIKYYLDYLGGYAYDPNFTQDLLKQQSLRRWEQLGTLSGYCGYAHAYLGFGWFFNDVIAPSHVRYQYGRMTLLNLFYQMTLRHYNRRISHATQALSEREDYSRFQKLRQEFILFTNNYWFRDVTNQIQGQEIFELQTKGLGLEKEYELIKDEMERADEYAAMLRTDNFNLAAATLASVALIVAVAAVWVTVLTKEWAVCLSIGVTGLTILALGILWWKLRKKS